MEAFRVFDLDGDGFIDTSEMCHVLQLLFDAGPAEAEAVMAQLDLDGDGRISFEEFSVRTTRLLLLLLV